MATNNMLPFCPTDTGTNLLSQGDYAVATDRTNGNQPGVASSKLVNKALRQSSVMASQLAQAVSDLTGADILDNGQSAPILGALNAALAFLPMYRENFTSSGTYYKSYYFFISSGSATAGATYTNNSATFTVVTTVASGTLIHMKGTGAPAASGTLTKSGGTGDNTLTFYAARAPIQVYVQVVGAGGGGGGAAATAAGQACSAGGGGGGGTAYKLIPIASIGTSEAVTIGTGGTGVSGASGNNGGNSSFGSHATANGGSGGTTGAVTTGEGSAAGGAGGTAAGGDENIPGGYGSTNFTTTAQNTIRNCAGGISSMSYPVNQNSANTNGVNGTGYGGGGSGSGNGSSQSARTGGTGSDGICIVTEIFQ